MQNEETPHLVIPPRHSPCDSRRPHRSERGASLVEYALLLVLIVLVAIGAVEILGTATGGSVSNSASSVASATN